MTRAEWEGSTYPQPMLQFLQSTGRLTERKARLFAVACCRRIGHLLTDEEVARPLSVGERFADGRATPGELRQADERAVWAGEDACWHSLRAAAAGWAAAAVALQRAEAAARGVVYQVGRVYAEDPPRQLEERLAQCQLLREMFEPFRPLPPLAPSQLAWGGGVIAGLALAAYEEQVLPQGSLDNGCLAVLADALEESGVTDQQLLAHLRSPGPHVRGCFALDAVRGKT
jgi:hypothetical protein